MTEPRESPKGLYPSEVELWDRMERELIATNDAHTPMQISTVMQYLMNTACAREEQDGLQARVEKLEVELEDARGSLAFLVVEARKWSLQIADIDKVLKGIV